MTDAIAIIDQSKPSLPLPRGISVGQKFEELTVVSRASNDASGRIRLNCTCSCGKECVVRLSDLRSGHTRSCGCLRAKLLRRKFGKIQLCRFGSLIAMGKAEAIHETRPSTPWVCFCVYCPQMTIATSAQLRSGKKLCACLKETYSSWRNMIQRCTNKNHRQYKKDYGGRGIVVYPEWRKSFQQFLYDMGKRPEGKTLDRINNHGPYSPKNCCWSTPKDQALSRRQRSLN